MSRSDPLRILLLRLLSIIILDNSLQFHHLSLFIISLHLNLALMVHIKQTELGNKHISE